MNTTLLRDMECVSAHGVTMLAAAMLAPGYWNVTLKTLEEWEAPRGHMCQYGERVLMSWCRRITRQTRAHARQAPQQWPTGHSLAVHNE